MVAMLVVFASACTTTASPTPIPKIASESQSSTAHMSRGQALFESRCIACHALYSPPRHSDEEWRELIPEMAQEANMTRSQTAAVLDYVISNN